MKKSIIIMTLLSFVLVLTLSISGCKKKADDEVKTDTTEHPAGDKDNEEHPTDDK